MEEDDVMQEGEDEEKDDVVGSTIRNESWNRGCQQHDSMERGQPLGIAGGSQNGNGSERNGVRRHSRSGIRSVIGGICERVQQVPSQRLGGCLVHDSCS